MWNRTGYPGWQAGETLIRIIGLHSLDVVMGLENRIVYNLVNVVEQLRMKRALMRIKCTEPTYASCFG